MEIKTCPNCLSKVGSVDVEATVCPYCKKVLSTNEQPNAIPARHESSTMAMVLNILGWIFAITGIIAGFMIYPKDPLSSPTLSPGGYLLARDLQSSQSILAWQFIISGIVAGVFTGALGCILSTLEQIRDHCRNL